MSRRAPGRRVALAGVWLACCLASTWGCGGGASPPTAPTPPALDLSRTDTPLALSAERYLLQLIGNDLSDDPALPACSPIVVPRGGKFVTTFLWFQWEGDELVGRSRPPYAATLEIRLRRVSSSILGVVVDGTVTGAAPTNTTGSWASAIRPSARRAAPSLSRAWSAREFGTTLSARPSADGCADRLRSGTRSGRSRCAPTRSTTWNRRDRAAPTTTRRCRPTSPRADCLARLELGPRAMEPASQQPGGPDRPISRICPDFIAISASGAPGTAVALRDAVTDRWAAGNQNH